jgi:hypothetical protein
METTYWTINRKSGYFQSAMFSSGSRVRLLWDSFALPEGTEGEVVGFYRRDGEATYIVRFPDEEQVLPAGDLELVEVHEPQHA